MYLKKSKNCNLQGTYKDLFWVNIQITPGEKYNKSVYIYQID